MCSRHRRIIRRCRWPTYLRRRRCRAHRRIQTAPVRKSKWPWVLFTLLLLGGVGAAGWFVYLQMNQDKSPEGTKVVMGSGSSGAGSGSAKLAVAPADAAEIKVARPDA